MRYTSIEICAGAGGQALGLAAAGFNHVAVVENDPHACATLRKNRSYWNTLEEDLTDWHATRYRGKVDLFGGGVCVDDRQAGCPGLLVHSGMFPCFLGGSVARLVRSSRSTRVISTRVSCGVITAST